MLSLPDHFLAATVPPIETAQVPGHWFIAAGHKLLVRAEGDTLVVPTATQWPFAKCAPARLLYLGTWQGVPCHGAELAEPAPPGWAFETLRGLWGRLEDGLLGIAGQALQLLEWDRQHAFCGRCGVPTARCPDERARQCPQCRNLAFPRLSPVIMVRVTRGVEILLARAPRFAGRMFSVLAGFVEAGETLEQTVHREVAEEVGIHIRDLRYFASQSWPFPHSLMLAFTAEYASGDLRVDGHEIVEAGWFTVDQLPELPTPMSMARRLIEDFRNRTC